MIRVCLVEDQTLVRQGLRSMLDLAGDVQVVAEAEDGQAALDIVPRVAPDLVLLDLRMPRLNGLGVLRALGERGALPPTLILTTFDDDDLVLQGIQAGAKGYLLKDVSLGQLLQAIRSVAAGKRWLQPVAAQRVLRGLDAFRGELPESALEAGVSLTERETEVLRLVAGGYSNREIAAALTTTEGTVKNYVSGVLSKLGARDRTRAVLKALELGVI